MPTNSAVKHIFLSISKYRATISVDLVSSGIRGLEVAHEKRKIPKFVQCIKSSCGRCLDTVLVSA